MPKVLRVALTADQCRDLHVLLAWRDLTRYTRQRLERIRLLDRAAPAELLDASAEEGITWTVPALRDWLRKQREGVSITRYGGGGRRRARRVAASPTVPARRPSPMHSGEYRAEFHVWNSLVAPEFME